MTSEEFGGYHSEWNLGSPGGWDYQRMTQELGEHMWNRVRRLSGLDLELHFRHPLLIPTGGLIQALLDLHQRNFKSQPAHIVVVAEEETLDAVAENKNIVHQMNKMPGVSAALAAPHHLRRRGDRVVLNGRNVTAIFVDFNNDVLLELSRSHDLSGLLLAVETGIVMNPRGTGPVNSKGVFELVGTTLAEQLSPSTVERTPWTRRFYPRSTIGPAGAAIDDLVEWTRLNGHRLVLKPEEGYSGKGVFAGWIRDNWETDIAAALQQGDYIVQEKIAPGLWAEKQPWLNTTAGTLELKAWQTDFRCLITHRGLAGFVARFGGIPTNVGSGGGVQSIALVQSDVSVREAVRLINTAIMEIGYRKIAEIKEEIDEMAVQFGLVYLLGPIMTALRPRLLTMGQVAALTKYAENLWNDTLFLESLWLEGKLDYFLRVSDEERALAGCQPWTGSPALIASDGLFNFGADVLENEDLQ